ncbi:glycerophosphodiester phosphodiesterase [Levilactobacillus tongjiangensis]|uniref:Glycerophosphodiester phosphodiesterase n=1 Tax=Levilactobacillus tongjiangensis TaxID=2486023 RepID=A0ABW1SSR5_9LACO|nr:glycerophosphodiester phosphodiesterase [Levilactobacillus tongjiangensis]
MHKWWQELRRSWRFGLMNPGLLSGWLGVALGGLSLRLVGQLPNTGWLAMAMVILTGVLVAGQLTRLALGLVTGRLPRWRLTGHLVAKYWLRWVSGLLALAVLALPFGMWGLGSQFLVHLTLPADWINFVGLNRRTVLTVVALIYCGLAGYFLLWGPVHFHHVLPIGSRPGTVKQMATGLGVSALISGLWLMGSEVLVVINRDLAVSRGVACWLVSGSLAVVLLGYLIGVGLLTVTLVWCWCGQPVISGQVKPTARPWLQVSLVLLVGVAIGGVAWQTVRQQPQFVRTLTISHRGVDQGVGVQNTLGALRHVQHHHPDYVEMDLHETRDHRWIVLHDENLRALAKQNVTPHQVTLAQLERLVVHENGYQDHLVGWPTYLRTAERRHQKLLIEIKTTRQDSSGMVARFAKEYGSRLMADHDAVHSLDYRVVRQLRQRVPQLRVGYITPFNWVAPRSVPADFYSFQQISISHQFIQAAHRMGAPAYVWTPDSVSAMTRSWALGADGQITNEVSRLQRVLKEESWHANWAVLQNFIFSYA